MKKNGFVFVETIVAIIILASSLLLLYSSFTNILQSEKTRVYYDDVTYIYRTNYIKKILLETNLSNAVEDLKSDSSTLFFKNIGLDTENLFTGSTKRNFLEHLLEVYEVRDLFIVKTNKIDNLKYCNADCALKGKCSGLANYNNCNLLYLNLSDEALNFMKTLYVIEGDYILVAEYESCDKANSNCRSYFSWVGINL